jgi:hypothetical protein
MHIMIDLETLGTDPDTAPIIQIGAVAFELAEDGPKDTVPFFRCHVNAASNLVHPFHREINPDTVAWWAETDPALLVQIMRGNGVPLAMALGELTIWALGLDSAERNVEGVWGNGATFDISMLEAAYRQEGMRVPWSFRVIRDVRTMAMIAGDNDRCWNGGRVTETERDGKKHDAVVDCLRQLRMVQQTWQTRVRHD